MGTTLEVANTIFEQIGGNLAFAMMGAKNIVGSDRDGGSLQWKVGRNAKKVTNVRVEYDLGSDTYTVNFYAIRGTNVKVLATHSGAHFDQLRSLIESSTGLYLSL